MPKLGVLGASPPDIRGQRPVALSNFVIAVVLVYANKRAGVVLFGKMRI